MLKKAMSILLIPVVLLSSAGITIFADYCPMKQELSVSLDERELCCCTGPDGENNCCESSTIVIEGIADGYVFSQTQSAPQQFDCAIFEYAAFAGQLISNSVLQNKFIRDFHPPDPPVSLSILYRSILI